MTRVSQGPVRSRSRLMAAVLALTLGAAVAASSCGGGDSSGGGATTSDGAAGSAGGGSDAAIDSPQDASKDAPAEQCSPDCTGKLCGDSDGCGGRCKEACAGGGTCQNGFCCSCDVGQSCCEGQCVSLGSDSDNCGACGNACTNPDSCLGGVCGTCTPNCATKECGPDGCGGTCGAGCATGQACLSGSCAPCVPACAGKECGPDGCGGTCGSCSGGSVCQDGTCEACEPSCDAKQCGEDDGCGGRCADGLCAGGGTCAEGACEGDCMPSCAGKQCGPDGCGGSCGMCAGFETCSAAGQCDCTPSCNITGYQCGSDGCGGTCGASCSAPTPCCVPPQGCLECADTVGCSDLTREGFVNVTQFSDIAACAGKWDGGQNLRASPTGTPCGDPAGGKCPGPADLCAPGWHVCMKNGWPADLRDRISSADCHSAVAGTGVFLAASDKAVSRQGISCEYSPLPVPCVGGVEWGFNYTLACGSDAELPAPTYGNGCHSQVWPSDTWSTRTRCNDAKNEHGVVGVLCCKDPPNTGS